MNRCFRTPSLSRALRSTCLAILMMGGLAACGQPAQAPEEPPLAGAAIGGPFSLTDQNGGRFTEANLRGRYSILYFGYSFCPDACPTDLQMIAQGLREFERSDPMRAARVLPVFITVDPERDTPAVIRSFVAAFHPRMIGLTGTRPQIDAVKKAFGIYAQRAVGSDAANYLVDHSRQAYLFGPDAKPIALIASDQTPADLAALLARWVR